MKKILLSAFACDPTEGSEPGNGWNWAVGLSQQGYEVHCLTREVGRQNIQSFTKPDNLFFHYINLPFGFERLYSFSQPTMYLHYLSWQWLAYKKAKGLHEEIVFDLIHHVTWGSLQMGSFLYKIEVPFIFGPAGGGQKAPVSFKKYFLDHWKSEVKREKVSQLFLKWNPGFKNMIKKASAVLVSNNDTFELAQRYGANNVHLVFDVGLPASFFPDMLLREHNFSTSLRLLWVGRFLPRKGLLLIVEVMAKLKNYPGITLTVVGDGEMRMAFIQAVEHLGLQDQVSWMGKIPFNEVKEVYASHDVFFFTSLRDSCGAQLIEAMAYGLPVITLNLHGSGMIVDTDRGITVEVSEPNTTVNELAKAVLELYEDRSKLKVLSEGASLYAKKHTWESIFTNVTNAFY
jgi:glycosyltransferase involved in cell wall biosynthesis